MRMCSRIVSFLAHLWQASIARATQDGDEFVASAEILNSLLFSAASIEDLLESQTLAERYTCPLGE